MRLRTLGLLLASAGAAQADAPPAALPPAAPAVPESHLPPAADCAPPLECAPATAVLTKPCGPYGRAWVSAEWLYWVGAGQGLPPLATSGTGPLAQAGVLGAPGTTVLIGGQRANNDWRNGFRLQAGAWLNDEQTYGIAGDFFFLGGSTERAVAGLGGPFVPGAAGLAAAPTIARPFVDAATGLPTTELVSSPGVLAGTVSTEASSDFIGGGLGVLCNLCCRCDGRWDFHTGYRYLNLRDSVTIREDLTALPGSNVVPGTRFQVLDRIRTDNDFHGVPVGVRGERRFGAFYAQANASVALGVSSQTTTIEGSTVVTPPGGAPTAFPGGLLAQTTNIGRYSSDEFAVVPEVGLRVGYAVSRNLRVFAGYTFLYWSNVARAGDQIDLRVNQNLLAPPQPLGGTPALPLFPNRQTDFWVQGISLGAELRF